MIKDRDLPARDLWKHARVRSGSVQSFSNNSFYQSFLREAVEWREMTISFFLLLHARGLASLMPSGFIIWNNIEAISLPAFEKLPLAGEQFVEVYGSKDRQRSACFIATAL